MPLNEQRSHALCEDQDVTPNQAWHYTTAAGLLNIVRHDRLWASSAAFMNDADEIRTGKRALQDAAAARKPSLKDWQLKQLRFLGVLTAGQPDEVFLLSASTDGDALTLWRSYGQGTEAEYALELDPSVALMPIIQDTREQHPSPPPGWGEEVEDWTDEGVPIPGPDPDEPYTWGGDWELVQYLSEGSTLAADELERIVTDLRPPKTGRLSIPFIADYFTGVDPSVLFKNPGFEDEREVRVTWTVNPWWKFVLYRPSRFGVTPYIEVGATNDTTASGTERDRNLLMPSRVGKLPLRSVRIGPTRATESAKHALRQLLDSYGYGATAIITSSAPYR